MQSRLEEEEEAKAALMSRIQRLTKLILVSTKNNIPALTDGHQRHNSVSEQDVSINCPTITHLYIFFLHASVSFGNMNYLYFQKLSTSQDSSTLVQNEGTTKDPLPDSLDEINQLRSGSGEHSSVTGSAADSMQVYNLPIVLNFAIFVSFCKVFSIVVVLYSVASKILL